MTILVHLRKQVMGGLWECQVLYDSENYIVSLFYGWGPSYPVASGIGKGPSYLSARDRAIENSGRAEGDWSRLLPELDEMVYEATRYQVPEIS